MSMNFSYFIQLPMNFSYFIRLPWVHCLPTDSSFPITDLQISILYPTLSWPSSTATNTWVSVQLTQLSVLAQRS